MRFLLLFFALSGSTSAAELFSLQHKKWLQAQQMQANSIFLSHGQILPEEHKNISGVWQPLKVKTWK